MLLDICSEDLSPIAAGAHAYLEGHDGAFFSALEQLAEPQTQTARLERLRQVARGYAIASVPVAMEGSVRLAAWLPHVGDNSGTSSHFLVSFVHAVASICIVFDEICDD